MVSRRDNIGPAIVLLLLLCGGGVASWFLAAPALSEMARPDYDVTRKTAARAQADDDRGSRRTADQSDKI
ncbi:hypothetical protein ACCS78_29380, partial [Rhizobium johnstonii]